MTEFRRRVRRRGRARGGVARLALVAAVALLTGLTFARPSAADAPSVLQDPTPVSLPLLGNEDAGVGGTPCSATARACVELATHSAWLMRDGQVVQGPVEFMDGDRETPTPRGTFRVEWKAEHWISREFGVPMPYSVFFAPGGIAFHQGSKDTSSAGCVKLALDDAVAFFGHLQVGDEVQVR